MRYYIRYCTFLIFLFFVLPEQGMSQEETEGYDLAQSGWEYFNEGRKKLAYKHVNKAIEINKRLCIGYHYLVMIELVLGNDDKAVENAIDCLACYRSVKSWNKWGLHPAWFKGLLRYDFESFRANYPEIDGIDVIAKLYNLGYNYYLPESYEEYEYYRDSIPVELRPYRTLRGSQDFLTVARTDIKRRLVRFPDHRNVRNHSAIIPVKVWIKPDGKIKKSEVDKVNAIVNPNPMIDSTPSEYKRDMFHYARMYSQSLLWEHSHLEEEVGIVYIEFRKKKSKGLSKQ